MKRFPENSIRDDFSSKHSVRKKLFLNYLFEFFYQLVASERKAFISIYYTSQPKISISLKGHVFRNAFRRPIHSKKCKNLQEGMKKAQIKQTCQNSYLKHSESDSKIPATLMRLAPTFQGITPTCLMLHKFGCNACAKKT